MEGTQSDCPLKYDWYQTEANVVITVLIKNIKQEELSIKFTNEKVDLHINSSEQHPELCKSFKLSHPINPEQCSYKLYSVKIEIKLKKLIGMRWEQLEGKSDKVMPNTSQSSVGSSNKPPSYPTSKGKDWSAIEKDISEQESKEKPEGDEALNKLFQEIYGKGSDEVKKAMNKSFMESGGTVLSTNWKEVAKDKVECKPPDGMEFKKWE